MTSVDRPPAISWQKSQTPHGSAVGPFSQHRALARMRAALVLPTPRAPVNRKAWCTRFCSMAFTSVRAMCSWPTSSENRCGRYLRARTRYDMTRNLLRTGGPCTLARPVLVAGGVVLTVAPGRRHETRQADHQGPGGAAGGP